MQQEQGGENQHPRTIQIGFSLRSVFVVIAIALGLWLIYKIWEILLLFVFVLIIAATFSPMVDGLEKRGLQRSVALGLILIALLAFVGGLGFSVIPALGSLLEIVATRLPEVQQQVADALTDIPPLQSLARELRETTPDSYVELLASSPLAALEATGEVLFYGITTVVLAFYILGERERMKGLLYALLPRSYHVRTAHILLDMETVAGGYVRGQLMTSLLMAAFTFSVLSFFGVSNALALSIIAALCDLIPLIGGILLLIPTSLATLSNGTGPAIIVLVALILYQEFENRILIPRIYGKSLRLSPVSVIMALLIGGHLLGVIGALLALPLAAGIRVFIQDMRIELPGEQPGESALREKDVEAEQLYAEQASGAPPVEAAIIATELAEQLQVEERAIEAAVSDDTAELDKTVAR